MKKKEYYAMLYKELANSKLNGESLIALFGHYETEQLVKSLYDRFYDVADAIQAIRRESNWTED